MADRRPKLIFDAISAIRAATSFCATASLLQYQQDLMLRSAVERQLEILGEACTRLLREHNTLVDELPEARLANGLRNRCATASSMATTTSTTRRCSTP